MGLKRSYLACDFIRWFKKIQTKRRPQVKTRGSEKKSLKSWSSSGDELKDSSGD